MNKFFYLFFGLLFFVGQSQTLYDDFNKYAVFGIDNKNEVDLNHLKKWGFHDIFIFNENELSDHLDSLDILNQIQFVTVKLKSDYPLSNVIQQLKSLPNLKYLKFHNLELFRDVITGLPFSSNIKELKSLETIDFYGSFDWDFNSVFRELKGLPNLKNVMLRGLPPDLLLDLDLENLNNIEGLWISGRHGPKIPQDIARLKQLNSLIISSDVYHNGSNELKKFVSNKKLQNLVLKNFIINDSILSMLDSFENLSRITINCPISDASKFFEQIGKNSKITELILANNDLDHIPPSIASLANLSVFYSSNNDFKKVLPAEFYSLNELRYIEIQGSKLEVIDKRITNFEELENLVLHYNKIKSIPAEIGKLSNLKSLILNDNMISEFDLDFESMVSLKKLKLHDNRILILPNSIVRLSKLDSLWLANNQLRALPEKFGELKTLRYINLEGNFLDSLPSSFADLNHLSYLNVSFNNLKQLPGNFGKLISLEELQAPYNLLRNLPENFGDLENLKTLNLRRNNLEYLPTNFGKLRQLNWLDLGQEMRNIERGYYGYATGEFIKDDIQLEARKFNNIKVLPQGFSALKKLKFLDLSNNQNLDEKALFNTLFEAEFVNYNLRVTGCNIQDLPNVGWKLLKIKNLDLNNNSISEIPVDIKNNTSLETLSIKDNNGLNLDVYLGNKSDISVFFLDLGILDSEALPKTKEIAQSYSKFANIKSDLMEYPKAIKYAEKAMEIDSIVADRYLYAGDIIKAYYNMGEYQKALDLSSKEIRSDTLKSMRILNFIVPNFKYKALCHLKLGDTINAIQDYVTLSERFGQNEWNRAGLLSRKIGDHQKSEEYFQKSLEAYQLILSQEPENWGQKLSLVEAEIIAGKNDNARSILESMDDKTLSVEERILCTYFTLVIKIISQEKENTYKKDFDKIVKVRNTEISNYWSFDLFYLWLKNNDLEPKINRNLEDLTNSINPTLFNPSYNPNFFKW